MNSVSLQLRLSALKGKESIRSFARRCGIPESTMRGYLNGTRKPVTESLEKIARACGRSLDWLLTGKPHSVFQMSNDDLKSILMIDPEVIEVLVTDSTVCPVVRAYDDLKKQIHYYCIHCRKWHHHGRVGGPYTEGIEGPGGGHRIALCIAKNSPFAVTGVMLNIVGKYEEVKTKHRDEETLICPKCYSYYSAALNACECGFVNNKRKSLFPGISEIYVLGVQAKSSEERDLEIEKSKNEVRVDRRYVKRRQEDMAREAAGSMSRNRFKMQCAGHFDELFDFVADRYGEDREAVNDFLDKLEKLNSDFKAWRDEKKQTRANLTALRGGAKIAKNGE